MEAMTKAGSCRPDEDGLHFNRSSTAVFADPPLDLRGGKPVVDLPVDIRTFEVKVFDSEGNFIRTKKSIRVLTQSDVGQRPVGFPEPEYFSCNTPAGRAVIRSREEAVNTYNPKACPWEGALIGFWHVCQRIFNDGASPDIQEKNNIAIAAAGNALRRLSRSVGDSKSEIVRMAVRRISTAKKPARVLDIITKIAKRYIKRAGDDQKLLQREAFGTLEEFCKFSKMTIDDIRRFGCLQLPDGRVIHMRNVVHQEFVELDSGQVLRFGETEDGDVGEVLSFDEIFDKEESRAESEMESRRAEKAGDFIGRNVSSIPVVLPHQVKRPELWEESEETLFLWVFSVKLERESNRLLPGYVCKPKHVPRVRYAGEPTHFFIQVEGTIADTYKVLNRFRTRGYQTSDIFQVFHPTWNISVDDGYSQSSWNVSVEGTRASADNLAHFIKKRVIKNLYEAESYLGSQGLPRRRLVGDPYDLMIVRITQKSAISSTPVKIRRTFSGYWNRKEDRTYVKSSGVRRGKLDITDRFTGEIPGDAILRNPQEGSGIEPGSYVEQYEDLTFIDSPDWMFRNIDNNPAVKDVLNDIREYEIGTHTQEKVQSLRRRIRTFRSQNIQRYLRSELRATIRRRLLREGVTVRAAEAVKPVLHSGFDFHAMRSKVMKAYLGKLTPPERRWAWAVINAYESELRAEGVRELQRMSKSAKDFEAIKDFATIRARIRSSDFKQFDCLNQRIWRAQKAINPLFLFFLRAELSKRRNQLKLIALPTARREFWKRPGIKVKPEFRSVLSLAGKLTNDNDLVIKASMV